MNAEGWMARCPYGLGSDMRRIYSALAKADGPLTMKEIASRSRRARAECNVPNMVAAMRSRWHGSSMRRAGVEVALDRANGTYRLRKIKKDSGARRPGPGAAKRKRKKR